MEIAWSLRKVTWGLRVVTRDFREVTRDLREVIRELMEVSRELMEVTRELREVTRDLREVTRELRVGSCHGGNQEKRGACNLFNEQAQRCCCSFLSSPSNQNRSWSIFSVRYGQISRIATDICQNCGKMMEKIRKYIHNNFEAK